MRSVTQAGVILVALGAGLALGVLVLDPTESGQSGAPRLGGGGTSAPKVLHFFTTSSCPYCDKMKQVMQEPAVKAALAHYEVKEEQSSSLAAKYKVTAYPTFIITDRQGNALSSQVGLQKSSLFAVWLTRNAQ